MKAKILVLTLFMVCSCSPEKPKVSSLLPYIPSNAAVVIRINEDATFKSELKNNNFLKQLSKTGVYSTIRNKTQALHYVQSNGESFLAFLEVGKANFELVYISHAEKTLLKLENVSDKLIETLTYENRTIEKYVVNEVLFFRLRLNDIVFISTSQIPLENIVRSQSLTVDTQLQKFLKVANTSKAATIFINTQKANPVFGALLTSDKSVAISEFTDFVALDVDAVQEQLQLNGVNIANDSVQSIVNLFNHTNPRNNTTAYMAPANTDALLSYTFTEYSIFAKNQQHYLDRSAPMDTLFKNVVEIGNIFMNTTKAVVLNADRSETIATFLDGLERNTLDYLGNEINELNQNDFLNTYFNPLVQNFTAQYYTILENSFVFAAEQETLQMIVSNFKNGNTFEQTNVYKTSMNQLADESSILFIANAAGLSQIMKADFANEVVRDFEKASLSDYVFAAQIVSDAGFYHTNMVIQKMEKQNRANSVSALFSVQLDAALATQPQFVLNHRTGKKEIVVQDIENYLYLISTDGKVLWKKQLSGRIQGPITQVDIYKNGRLQLAFTTDHHFLILDRNGEEVKPFNTSFDGEVLNPLAVFDYDGTKEYRFVVVHGTKIHMYNAKGEIVKGFTYTEAENPILGTPKHIRSGKRDYLVFRQKSGHIKILDRTGRPRIPVAEKIDFSENEVVFYEDTFTMTDTQGALHQIEETGKIKTTPLALQRDHGMDATTKTLVLMNDNVLQIKDKKLVLDLGMYSKPKLFVIKNKIYVSVTDLQNRKVYLFDSNGKAIPNFPVMGNSMIDLAEMDKDGKLALVVKDLDNSLIVYKMY
ncbi:ribonuclease HII [Arenibacter sp. GZD96]|uniref:hypothetical protein n=1 Tax=Aurantibrevibacter litoralis TaxID=3106030 RepID=UPI002AFEB82B|nr:hypothetical protein [Arenibacter sp. GZD-96]MEA1787324.1 ribonuclease HII [Arenibacter sp. GZD-96]